MIRKNILRLINQIFDKKLKRKIIESCINEESSNSSDSEIKIDDYGIIKYEGYFLTEIFKRMKINESFRPINLKKLKLKINDLK